VRNIAADELRGRRAAVAAVAVGAGIVAIAVILGRRSLRTRCSCGPVSGGPRPR
jgi:hypothetical protein